MSRSTRVSDILSSIHRSNSHLFTMDDVTILRDALSSRVISYYELLSVQKNDLQIKIVVVKNYRSLAPRFHPNAANVIGSSDAKQRIEIFKLLQNAYETLKESDSKKRYDERNRNPLAHSPDSDRYSDSANSDHHARRSNDNNVLSNPELLVNAAKSRKWDTVKDCLETLEYCLTDGLCCNDEHYLNEFSKKFRAPIISVLKASLHNRYIFPNSYGYEIFDLTFSVFAANKKWSIIEMLADPRNRDILFFLIDKKIIDSWSDFHVHKYTDGLFLLGANWVYTLLLELNEDLLEKFFTKHLHRIIELFFDCAQEYFQQMNLSRFSPFIIERFTYELTKRAIADYYTEKCTQACCSNNFFFSWKSGGSKNIYYKLSEIMEGKVGYAIGYGHNKKENAEVKKVFKNMSESIYQVLLDHHSEVGPHLLRILQHYQLLDHNRMPSKKFFSSNDAYSDRMSSRSS